MLEAILKLPLESEIFIDGMTLIAVVDSLPQGQEIELEADSNVLNYSAGSARGRLALLAIDGMRSVPRVREEGWEPGTSFIRALELGAMSCDSEALATIGMYGIAIDRRKKVGIVRSTDNITISSCEFDSSKFKSGPELMVIVPDAANLLSTVMAPQGKMVITGNGIHYQDACLRCFVGPTDDLRMDLAAIRDPLPAPKTLVSVPRERVMAFAKRAAALAENKRGVVVQLSTSEGRLVLGFEEGSAQAEEFYLIDEVKVPDLEPIKLDGQKLARALQHVTEVALDYMSEKDMLMFRAKEPPFEYLIMGKR